MTKQQLITKHLSTLFEYFDKAAVDEVFKLYVVALDRYSEEELEMLFRKIVATCRYFPRIAEIEEMMGSTGAKQLAGVNSRAYEAFDEAVSMMRKIGSYRTPKFDDPIISAVIKSKFNGWIRFGMTTIDDWARKSFVEEYKALSEAGTVPQVELEGMHKRKRLGGGGAKQIGEFIKRE